MGDASVELDLNAQQLYNELQQVQQHFVQFADKVKGEGEKAGKGFTQGFKGGFGSVGTNLVQGIAALGIGHEIESIVEKFSQIEDIGRRFRVPVEGLQRIANAAEKLGVPIEGVAKAFRFLELARDKALAGQTEFQKKFEDAGLTMEQLKDIHIEDLFVAVGSKSISAIDGVKLFGRAFADVRPLAEGLASGTVKFGEALNAADVHKIKEIDDTFKSLRQTLEIFVGGLISSFVKNFQASIVEIVSFGLAAFEEIKGIGSAIAAFVSHNVQAIGAAAHGHFSEAGHLIQEGASAAGKELSEHSSRAEDIKQEGQKTAEEFRTPAAPKETPRPTGDIEPGKEEAKEEEKLQKEREKNAGKERAIELDKLTLAEKLARLKAEAAVLETSSSNEAVYDEKEREELHGEYLDTVKEIGKTEKEIAAEAKKSAQEKSKGLRAEAGTEKRDLELEHRAANPTGLSLHDIASANIIGNPAIAQAREAEREEKIAKERQLAGDLTGAAAHQNRAEELKKALGLDNRIDRDEVKKLQQESRDYLKNIDKNTENIGANK